MTKTVLKILLRSAWLKKTADPETILLEMPMYFSTALKTMRDKLFRNSRTLEEKVISNFSILQQMMENSRTLEDNATF